jgi:hypothetical protein
LRDRTCDGLKGIEELIAVPAVLGEVQLLRIRSRANLIKAVVMADLNEQPLRLPGLYPQQTGSWILRWIQNIPPFDSQMQGANITVKEPWKWQGR